MRISSFYFLGFFVFLIAEVLALEQVRVRLRRVNIFEVVALTALVLRIPEVYERLSLVCGFVFVAGFWNRLWVFLYHGIISSVKRSGGGLGGVPFGLLLVVLISALFCGLIVNWLLFHRFLILLSFFTTSL